MSDWPIFLILKIHPCVIFCFTNFSCQDRGYLCIDLYDYMNVGLFSVCVCYLLMVMSGSLNQSGIAGW